MQRISKELVTAESMSYANSSPQAKRSTLAAGRVFSFTGESEQGRLVDALAPGGDEGRDKLR